MPTMKELVKEYNGLLEVNTDIKIKPVSKFPTIAKGEHRLKLLKESIKLKRVETKPKTDTAHPTLKNMIPKGGSDNVQDPSKPISREEAIEKSYILYWNGELCSNGHMSPRYSKTGVCKKCYQLFRAAEYSQSKICKDRIIKKKDKK